MAKRKLEFEIVGDPRDLQRALGTAGKSASKFEGRMDRVNRAMKVAGAAAAGAAVVGLKKSADAAIEAEKSQARLEAQLKAVGTSYAAHEAQINKVIGAQSRLSALDDEDLQDSFTAIVRVTGDVNEALRLNALAADIARARNIDVAKAGELVAKVASGNTNVLKRYGVQVKEGATAQEALAAAQATFAGQAEAYGNTTAGSIEKANVAWESILETVGAAVAPAIEDAADSLAKFVGEMQSGTGAGGEFAKTAGDVADAVGRVVRFLKDNPALVATAVGAWAAYKTAVIAATTISNFKHLKASFARTVPIAATQGTAAGAAYSGAAATASAGGITAAAGPRGKMGKAFMLAGRALPVLMIAQLTWHFRKELEKAGDDLTDALQDTLGKVIGDGAARSIIGDGDPDPAKLRGKFGERIRGKLGERDRQRSGRNRGANSHPDNLARTSGLPRDAGGGAGSRGAVRGNRGGGTTNRVAGSRPAGGGGMPPLAAFLGRTFGLRFESGYRNPADNAAAGGVPNSWHTRGSASRPGAIDMTGARMGEALAWARANVPGLAEAMIHDAGSGLHLHLAGPGVMSWGGAGRGAVGASPGGVSGSSGSMGGSGGVSSGPTREERQDAARRAARRDRGTQLGNQRTAINRARRKEKDRLAALPTPLDFLERDMAAAELTPDGADDRDVLGRLRDHWMGTLGHAKNTGNVRLETEALQALRPILEALADVGTKVEDNTAAVIAQKDQQIEVLRQQLQEAVRTNAISIANGHAFESFKGGITRHVSRELGSNLGLGGSMLSAAPGTMSRI